MALPIQRREKMRKLWLMASTIFALVAGMNFAETAQLNNFHDILSALKSGNRVSAVFHYKDCKLVIDGETVEEVPDAIASSQSVLISHPVHGFVLNFVKLNVFDNGDVKIVAKYLTPGDLEVKMDESFHTVIHDGKNTGAACFFLID